MLVSLSSISFSMRPSSSSLGPIYWPGGLKGIGRGSRGAGRNGSSGFLGSKPIPPQGYPSMDFSVFPLYQPSPAYSHNSGWFDALEQVFDFLLDRIFI